MPTWLLRYDAADWPHPECHPECAYWAAVEKWREENPIDLDDAGPLVILDGPDAPFHPEWI